MYIPRFTTDSKMIGHKECIIDSFSVETLVKKKANRVYTESEVFANVTWVRNGSHFRHSISELYRTPRSANKRAANEYMAYIREYNKQEITRQEQEIEKCKQKIKEYRKGIKSIQKVLNNL